MKFCDCCYGTNFEIIKGKCRCLECGVEYDSYEELSNAPELTLDMVKNAYKQGAIKLIHDDSDEIMCQIGEMEPFLFDGLEGEGFKSVQDYLNSYGNNIDDICTEILSALNDIQADGLKEYNDIDEWLNYACIVEKYK